MSDELDYILDESGEIITDEFGYGITSEWAPPLVISGRARDARNDIALKYSDGLMDLALGEGEDSVEAGLQTAIIISLFTDRRAEDNDTLPDGGHDKRGWWGDIHPQVDGDKIGSRLWLLSREKQTKEALQRAETYASEALKWMVDDGVAAEITVAAENPAEGILALYISIKRPDGEVVDYRFKNLWEAEYAV